MQRCYPISLEVLRRFPGAEDRFPLEAMLQGDGRSHLIE